MKKIVDPTVACEEALRKGNVLHAWSSGGGLMVVRIEKGRHGKLMGYGEHPHIHDALAHAAEDFLAGGRPYSEVYGTFDMDDPNGGKTGIYPMYLTGDPSNPSQLDKWVRNGTFDAAFKDGKFEVDLHGWGEFKTPDDIVKRCTEGQETVEWDDGRGCKFASSPTTLPGNGKPACSTRTVSRPEGMKQHRVWIWRTIQTGRANTLTDAFSEAFKAKSVETNED